MVSYGVIELCQKSVQVMACSLMAQDITRTNANLSLVSSSSIHLVSISNVLYMYPQNEFGYNWFKNTAIPSSG